MKLAIQFPNLEQAMRDSGFGRETVDTALAWLDISKERDTALLKKLTVQDSKINQNKKPVYHIAFRQDVIPHGSEELYRRIILMSYQLLDAEACIMTGPLFHEIPDMKFDAFQKLTDDTMQEVWGDEAQARSFAMRYAMYTLRTGITNADLPAEHTPYLKAADLTSDKCSVIKLMLCANALEDMPLPEGESLSDEAQRAVSIIKHIMQGNSVNTINVLTALAPASWFDA